MSIPPNRIPALLLTAALLVTLAATTGCYRKEISRRGYPGFSIETGAEPPPRAQPANFPAYKPPEAESDPLGDLLSPVTGLFRAIGQAFEGPDAQHANYTPPRPDGVPHKPKPQQSKETITLFPPEDPAQER